MQAPAKQALPKQACLTLMRNRLAGAALACSLSALPALAQTTATPPSPVDSALLQAFGQQAGLQGLADDFVIRLLADARIGHFFKTINPKHLKKQLADQFCSVLHGPCEYDGETMKNSHAGLDIARKDFNALVEVLQDAMDAQQIPFAAQKGLLARLAPMHRDIVTAR